mgnify:FL=1
MLLFIFLYFLPDATNYITEPSILPHTEFYNETLDSIELFREYTNWQNPNYQGGFSFCQYPFLLTISAKKQILQKDSEQQMISQARVCLPLPLPNYHTMSAVIKTLSSTPPPQEIRSVNVNNILQRIPENTTF